MDTSRNTYRTPRGNRVELFTRPDTNDAAMVTGLLSTDEYQLRDLDLSGWALDIGSHVGTIAIALAVDNPNLSVIAIEPVPDNAELIRRNVAVNFLGTRVFVEEAGAGALGQATTPCMYGYTESDNPDTGYMQQSRFVGNLYRTKEHPVGTSIEARAVSLSGLVAKYGVTDFRFAKIDCEGCEYQFLSSGAEVVEEIIGEWHDGPPEQIYDILEPTHHVTIYEDKGGIGLFRAVRKL